MRRKKEVRYVLRRKRRSLPSEVKERIREAIADPALSEMGVVESMRKHRLNYSNIMSARRAVLSHLIKSGKSGDLLRIQEARDSSRLRAKVMRAETSFPLIHRRLLTEKNKSHIAEDYEVTRQRVSQIYKQFNSLLRSSKLPQRKLLDIIEEECRSS